MGKWGLSKEEGQEDRRKVIRSSGISHLSLHTQSVTTNWFKTSPIYYLIVSSSGIQEWLSWGVLAQGLS